ncbi:hypothetical protein ALP83_05648 [Pseudomonas syringae pv. actinidiae]|uniref:Uncharacterized protein n=1 Tax=Pseudomonas syringae pv. actinidiae TaxID=103796 RepID=A0A7Z6Y1K4_PSESF|nr:hypothetical protein ALP83_05648 [Pseudomonas syringae pv. actinidiae]
MNIARRLLAWTNTRNKGTGLLQVFRYVFRIEHQRRIEEAEENNPCTKQQNIQRLTRSDRLRDVLQPAQTFRLTKPGTQRSRKQQNAAREDGWNNASHVHFQRQVACLCSEDLAALLTLGVVNSNTTLTTLNKHHETDDRYRQQTDSNQSEDVDITLTRRLERLPNCSRKTSDDTCEDQHRDTVADTALGNLLAQPHHEHRTCHEGSYGHKVETQVPRKRDALTRQANGHADSLNKSQDNSAIAGVLAYLATASFTFLLQLLQLRADGGHQLHDDRCRNVRHDPQCKDAHPFQRATGKHVEQAKNGPLILSKQFCESVRVNTWNRDVCAYSVDDNRQEQKTQTSPEFRHTAFAERRESTLLSHLFLELAASCFDSRTRTFGGGDTLDSDSASNFARQHDFHTLNVLVNHVGIFQGLHSYDVAFHFSQLGQTHFCAVHGFQGNETEFWQATMQRLLAALKARSNSATGAGALTFVATATGLAQTATDTTARTMLFATGTRRWTQIIEFHRLTLDSQHVVSLVDHPAIFGSIQDFYSVTDATQTQTLNAQSVIRDAAGHAFDQRYFNGSHDQMISSTRLPRLAAIDSGDCMPFKPLKVA